MIRPLTGNVPWSVTVAIAQVECLAGRNARYVIGQKPYDGSEILETSAAVSEARFTRYNEIRKQSREIQTSAASYGWLLASIKMSWYLRYHGWKKTYCTGTFISGRERCVCFCPGDTKILRRNCSEKGGLHVNICICLEVNMKYLEVMTRRCRHM